MGSFFKSAAFKSVVVLLSIIIVCGGLLGILSDVLYISNEERASRAIGKIYTETTPSYEELSVNENYSSLNNSGVIKTVYKIDNGDYLIKVTGKKGFANGNVTLWVAVKEDLSVRNAVLDSNSGQTLIAKLSSHYAKYGDEEILASIMECYESGKSYTTDADTIVSGATYSSTAANNAVAVAVEYVEYISQGGNA